MDDRFQATNLNPSAARTGHKQSLVSVSFPDAYPTSVLHQSRFYPSAT